VVCAKKPGDPAEDNEQTRKILLRNAEWAQRAYNGTDVNGNNVLDSNEIDLRGDGRIVRYVLPTPPPSPAVRFEVGDRKVTVYWNDAAEQARDLLTNRKHFEGYRLYRSNPQEELSGRSQLHLVAQFDVPNNGLFADNGFESIRIRDENGNPTRYYFEDGDTVGYTYKYEFTHLLNGWVYRFALTSFSSGDPQLKVPSLESSTLATEVLIIPGQPPVTLDTVEEIGIFPNPYYLSAVWDRSFSSPRAKRLCFYNLPQRAEILIYAPSGDLVKLLSGI